MRSLFKIAQAAAVALALFSASGARGEIFSVCSALPTPDGFVALRDSPSLSGRLIARMYPDEIVVIDVKGHDFVRSGGWLSVSHYPGTTFPRPADPGYAKVRRGWVKEKLVGECG
jgi:hypothetical protein